jgi:hypothetical protein
MIISSNVFNTAKIVSIFLYADHKKCCFFRKCMKRYGESNKMLENKTKIVLYIFDPTNYKKRSMFSFRLILEIHLTWRTFTKKLGPINFLKNIFYKLIAAKTMQYNIYTVSINDCQVKPALEKILLCHLFETDVEF